VSWKELTYEDIQTAVFKLRKQGLKEVDGNRFVLSKHNPEARLVKTQHLQETPLNLVIVLDDLISAGVGKEIKKGID